MEEAGFRNCVSVPDGAPSKVSTKELPAEEEVCTYTDSLMYVLCWVFASSSCPLGILLHAKYSWTSFSPLSVHVAGNSRAFAKLDSKSTE